jgi:hypothetical protein
MGIQLYTSAVPNSRDLYVEAMEKISNTKSHFLSHPFFPVCYDSTNRWTNLYTLKSRRN